MRELLKKQGFAPKLLVTDKLRPIRFGVPAAAAELPHERGLRRNNRTENSHRADPLHRGLELRKCSRILRCYRRCNSDPGRRLKSHPASRLVLWHLEWQAGWGGCGIGRSG